MTYETPINRWRLSKKGRDLFDKIEAMKEKTHTKITVTKEQYEELLQGIPYTIQNYYYSDRIPFGNKVIVRR